MSIVQEFKDFINRGNVIDLAVAVIIGASFGKVVSSLVNDIIMPPIGWALGGVDFSKFGWTLKGGEHPVVINYGTFINAIIDFLIVSACVFFLIKAISTLRKQEPAAPTSKPCPECRMDIPVDALRCGHCTSYLSKKEGSQ